MNRLRVYESNALVLGEEAMTFMLIQHRIQSNKCLRSFFLMVRTE